jgi:predicted MFS family arabinose efflux permease
VVGVALGGILKARFGWRWSFGVMALLGLALTVLHRLVVSDGKVARHGSPLPVDGAPEPVDVPLARLTALVRSRPLVPPIWAAACSCSRPERS